MRGIRRYVWTISIPDNICIVFAAVMLFIVIAVIGCATTGRSAADLVAVTNRNTELVTGLQGVSDSLSESNRRATERIDSLRVEAERARDAAERAIILFREYTFIVADLLRENQQLQLQVTDLLQGGDGTGYNLDSSLYHNDTGLYIVCAGREAAAMVRYTAIITGDE